jgi:hypothetical protein
LFLLVFVCLHMSAELGNQSSTQRPTGSSKPWTFAVSSRPQQETPKQPTLPGTAKHMDKGKGHRSALARYFARLQPTSNKHRNSNSCPGAPTRRSTPRAPQPHAR